MIGDDRRSTPRVAVSVPVQFELEDGTIDTGTIENLSESGMLLVTNLPIERETSLRVMFGTYESESTVELRGRVVRSAELGKFGVSFVEVGERAVEAVRTAMMRTA